MPRPSGTRSEGYKEKRQRMLDAIGQKMAEASGKPLSWRQMADAAGVGLATLKHYFGTREDVVRALLVHWGERGRQPLEILATRFNNTLEESLQQAAEHLVAGLDHGVDHMIGVGLAESLTQFSYAPTFLEHALEPMFEAFARRIEAHQSHGEFRADTNPRFAAISFITPLLIAHLHQNKLCGAKHFPMDFQVFLRAHVTGFVRAYQTIELPD